MTTSNLTALDEQIAAANAAVDAAQNSYRSSPRGGMMMGGPSGPVRIDPELRAERLDRGLAVDDAVIRFEQINRDLAAAQLAELLDAEAIAAEDAAVEAAQRDVETTEAAAAAARKTYQGASYARKERTRRIAEQRRELARAQAAIASAQSVRAKEQAQRDELVPFLPTSAPESAVARAS